jgi:hypothetical protein
VIDPGGAPLPAAPAATHGDPPRGPLHRQPPHDLHLSGLRRPSCGQTCARTRQNHDLLSSGRKANMDLPPVAMTRKKYARLSRCSYFSPLQNIRVA